jgi:hypothetical protein
MNFANKYFSALRSQFDQVIDQARTDGLLQVIRGYSSKCSRKQKALIVVFTIGLLVLILLSPAPKDVRPVNVHARSLSVAWVLPRPTFGCVVLVPTSFSSLPKVACNRALTSVHLQELSGLEPETSYRIWVWSGLRPIVWGNPRVTTTAVREEMPNMPKPGYGSVVYDNLKTPGALVLVYANTPESQYAVAAITNDQGNYAVDLANLKHASNSFFVDGFLRANRLGRLEADIRFSTPFPPLLLNDQLVPWWENLWLKFKGAL